MPLNVVKSIPLKYAATSITLIDGGVITTTGVDSFSVVVNAHVKLHQEIRVWALKSAPP